MNKEYIKELHLLYEKAIPYYLSCKSIQQTCNEYNIKTRKSFVEYVKGKGIDVINYNNQLKCNELAFSEVNSEEVAYWLGLLYADGYINANRNRLELGLCEKDVGHIEKFRQFTKCQNKITYKSNPLGNSCRIGMSSKQLIDDLKRLGCINCKSLILKFPNETQVPKHQIYNFLRGYFDGDGYLGIREIYNWKNEEVVVRPRCGIVGTYEFIQGYNNALGFEFKDKQLNKKGKAYQYIYSQEECYLMLDSLYKNASVYLDRKYDKYRDLMYNK